MTELPNTQLAHDCCWIFKDNYTFNQWVERVEQLHEKYPGLGFDRAIDEVMEGKKKAQERKDKREEFEKKRNMDKYRDKVKDEPVPF